jgi:hypothetical protein
MGAEIQVKHVLPPKIDSVGFAVSSLHEDVKAFRGATEGRFNSVDRRLDRHGELLEEILRRLPPVPED